LGRRPDRDHSFLDGPPRGPPLRDCSGARVSTWALKPRTRRCRMASWPRPAALPIFTRSLREKLPGAALHRPGASSGAACRSCAGSARKTASRGSRRDASSVVSFERLMRGAPDVSAPSSVNYTCAVRIGNRAVDDLGRVGRACSLVWSSVRRLVNRYRKPEAQAASTMTFPLPRRGLLPTRILTSC
jgi:hypothetical protein